MNITITDNSVYFATSGDSESVLSAMYHFTRVLETLKGRFANAGELSVKYELVCCGSRPSQEPGR